MSSAINPEAVQPFITQGFEQSDRNPQVTEWGGVESDGGQLPTPDSSESRVTAPEPAPSADAGLVDYNTGDGSDRV